MISIIVASLILGCGILGYFIWLRIGLFLINSKKKRIMKKDLTIKEYFKNFDDKDKLAIIDETPREVFIGNRFYLLKPLKYRQYTRLCILFAHTLQGMKEAGIDVDADDPNIGDVVQNSEDDFFKAVALILYYSHHDEEENETTAFEGIQKEFNYLKANSNINQLSRVLEIVMIQNDVQRALKAFGLVGKKKV
jgi:hypothetical protein